MKISLLLLLAISVVLLWVVGFFVFSFGIAVHGLLLLAIIIVVFKMINDEQRNSPLR